MTTDEPLTTLTVSDWPAVQSHIEEHASATAQPLPALTTALDDELHHLVLDPETRTIWWAWDNSPLSEEGWTVEQLSPDAAAAQLGDQVDLIQDYQDNPQWYAEGNDTHRRDQDALDEYTEILRLSLPDDPAEAAAHIKRKRHLIARQDSLWQRTYAEMVRNLAGGGRGGKARAARALGISDMQVGRIIREDDTRRAELDDAVQAERAARP